MHCSTDMQSLRLAMSNVKDWSGVSKSFCTEILSLKTNAFSGPSPERWKGANCMGLTAPKSMHIGNRVTCEAKM